MQQARRDDAQPPSDRELDAAARLRDPACSGGWAWAFPGAGQLCTGKPGAGAALMAVGAAELGSTVAVASSSPRGLDHPAAAVSAIGLQDVWLYGIVDVQLDRQRAARLRYVPPDNLGELVRAPFNFRVLRKPDVWLGIIGLTAAGVGASLLTGEHLRTGHFGESPDIFGHRFRPAAGYPLGTGIHLALFEQVAVAEETTFRGYIQSGLARATDETTGWLLGSLIFGFTHALNVFALPPGDRGDYLLYGVPSITVIGSYLGLDYRWNRYSLAPSVALHFWYDFLLTSVFFLADPQHSPLSASVTVPF